MLQYCSMNEFYKIKDERVLLNVKVTTKASKNAITGTRNGELLISVTNAPENDKANSSVIKILSDALHIAKSKIQIVSGNKNRNKVISLDVDEEKVKAIID